MTGKKDIRIAKERLDQLLTARGVASSRAKAQALIVAGQVLVNGAKIEKAGTMVPADADIRVLGGHLRYVGRGGLKLEAALEAFGMDVSGRTCLDIGASTGGFTDCLLQHGAAQVVAVDVGYGQLAWKLRQDPRVSVIERTNVRDLDPAVVPVTVSLAVIDVSFISLEKVIPPVLRCLPEGGTVICLVKPQFEAGREQVGKGGIVRDEAVRKAAVDRIASFLRDAGCSVRGIIPSPIAGQDGNREYLIGAVKECGKMTSGTGDRST